MKNQRFDCFREIGDKVVVYGSGGAAIGTFLSGSVTTGLICLALGAIVGLVIGLTENKYRSEKSIGK